MNCKFCNKLFDNGDEVKCYLKHLEDGKCECEIPLDTIKYIQKQWKYYIKKKIFTEVCNQLKLISNSKLIKCKTINGDTQCAEKPSINLVSEVLHNLNYSYKKAGSQEPKDFQNIKNMNLNIEVKKTDGYTVYFNDTLPNKDVYYVIIFTGKVFSRKKNVPPQFIFINGFDLIFKDIYHLYEYKDDINGMRDKWSRKGKNNKANLFKTFSVCPRATYKTDIKHLLNYE